MTPTVRPSDTTTSRAPTTTLRSTSGIDLYSRRAVSPGDAQPTGGYSSGSTLRPSPPTSGSPARPIAGAPTSAVGEETPAVSPTRISPGRVRFPAPSETLSRPPSGRSLGNEPRSSSGVGAVDRYRTKGPLTSAPGRTARPDFGRRATPVAGNDGARTNGVRYGNGPVRRLEEPLRGVRTTAPGRTLTPDRPRTGSGSERGLGSGSNGSKGGFRRAGETGSGSATRTVDTGRVRGVTSRLSRLDGLRRTSPEQSDRIVLTGNVIGRAQYTALRAGVRAIGGVYAAPYRGVPYSGYSGYYGYGGYGACYTPWGFSYYNGCFSFSFGFGYRWGYPCYSYWWPTYFSCWYPLWYWCYRPYYYASTYPAYATTVVYQTTYVDESEPYAEAAPAALESQEPSVAAPRTVAPAPTLGVAAQRYLVLGDRAFREGRYAHAVQFYAKAVELAPTEGALHLVLADALFAAGDYHYGAYAVRRAIELEPTLVDAVVDKHGFYTDPAEFDRQLAVLELYVEEHPTDRDARLVLGINYLMGGRPAAAVDLLESPASAGLSDDAAAARILDAARLAQYGPRVPVGNGEGDGNGDG